MDRYWTLGRELHRDKTELENELQLILDVLKHQGIWFFELG